MTSNRWYHAAAVLNRSTARAKMYLDGAEAGSFAVATNFLSQSIDNSQNLIIGSGSLLPNIDMMAEDVRLYDRALSEDEIRQIYLQQGADGIITNLGARWQFTNGAPGSLVGSIRSLVSNDMVAPVGAPLYGESPFGASRRR